MPPIIYQNFFLMDKHISHKRIVCLVPSITQLLHSLGLEAEVVGITKFCVHPRRWYKNKIRVGGTKTVDIQKVKQLQPHLIIANKEENTKEQIEELSELCTVYLTDVSCLQTALQMIGQIGQLTQKQQAANSLAAQIQHRFEAVVKPIYSTPAAYLIWQKPYITIGGNTFIHNMMEHCGLQNLFGQQQRYPETTVEQLQALGCRLLLLSSEPFPFAHKHQQAMQAHLPNSKIILVDGEIFSWYGSKLLQAPAYFNKLAKLIADGANADKKGLNQ